MNAARLPVVFVSHGAPDALLKAPEVVRCWEEIGQAVRAVAAPQAILVVSAHWETRVPTLSLAGMPATLHDFAGFAPELYRLHYPAPGAPALAERILRHLGRLGIAADLHPNRGLDHGAWVPLLAMFPQANIPVLQLSVARTTPAALRALGAALAPLREEGVLLLASGAVTHNFDWIDWRATADTPPLPAALEFADWVAARLTANDAASLDAYRTAPQGAAAHPTPEHFLPLCVAAGAGAITGPAELYRPPFAYAGLAMDAYRWH